MARKKMTAAPANRGVRETKDKPTEFCRPACWSTSKAPQPVGRHRGVRALGPEIKQSRNAGGDHFGVGFSYPRQHGPTLIPQHSPETCSGRTCLHFPGTSDGSWLDPPGNFRGTSFLSSATHSFLVFGIVKKRILK